MRFHNLQLLRLAAALAVVAFHLGVHGGNVFQSDEFPIRQFRDGPWVAFPVPLFFALSGFVLAHALQATPPGRFLFGRFLRLYPGYWVAMGLALLAICHTVWPPDQAARARFSMTAFLLTPGGPKKGFYALGGIEWSLIYEVFLSVALAALSLLGVRRGMPLAVIVWLAVLGTKLVVQPGYALDPYPHWTTVFLSAYSTPFLLGVLAYYLKDRGRRLRWLVLAALAAHVVYVIPLAGNSRELHWCAWGVAGATAVWFAVQVRQVSQRNPLARLGDCTYGLYLVHVPLMMPIFFLAYTQHWSLTPPQVVWIAGVVAVAGGLLYGAFESWLHGRLRPLAKVRVGDIRLAAGRRRAWPARSRSSAAGSP